MKITDRGVAALKPSDERYEVWEDGRTGFGLRVSRAGRKTWLYMYRFNGKARRMSLGTYPQVSLADARIRHAEAKKRRDAGDDPGVAQVEQNRLAGASPSVRQLAEEYLEKWAYQRKRSAREDERILYKDVVPAWEGLKAYAVTRLHVNALLDVILERGAPIQANRTLAVVRKMYNFAVSRGIVEINPCTGVTAPAGENRRDRMLNANEIAAFWHKLDRCPMTEPVRIALKLQLVTAQRKGEIIGARWDEIDLDEAVWTIPAHRSKNKNSHRVPLSPMALELLNELRAIEPEHELLFPSPRGEKPITGPAVDHALRHSRAVIGVSDFTPHDLRRTAASHMTSIGIPRFTVKKLLNHVDRDVTAVYDRHSYDQEKREALDKWSKRIKEIVAEDFEAQE